MNKTPRVKKTQRGFTLLELMIALVLVSILVLAANASYGVYIERARVAGAIGDIGEIHIAIQTFLLTENRGYPTNLADLGLDGLNDPWGNPYKYLVVGGLGNNGAVRKDKNLIPVNSGYDVYSMGKDGKTASPLNSTTGGDDVVMAGDGTYFGLGEDF